MNRTRDHAWIANVLLYLSLTTWVCSLLVYATSRRTGEACSALYFRIAAGQLAIIGAVTAIVAVVLSAMP